MVELMFTYKYIGGKPKQALVLTSPCVRASVLKTENKFCTPFPITMTIF